MQKWSLAVQGDQMLHLLHTGYATGYFNTFSNIHTHPFNGPLSGTTRVSQYQKGKTNLDFTEARDSEWQWHQLGRMQVCTSHQTDNHTSTSLLSFLQAGCPSCRPTNSVKALKANIIRVYYPMPRCGVWRSVVMYNLCVYVFVCLCSKKKTV